MAAFSLQVIERAIEEAGLLYHRLVLLVGPAGAGKTEMIRSVHQRTNAPVLAVSLELSRRLLDLTVRQRILRVSRLLTDRVSETASGLILLDNIELLFDVSLKQDPLRLLQGLSRNRTVVAAWSGRCDGQHLVYGTKNHPEYRRYPVQDFLVVTPEA